MQQWAWHVSGQYTPATQSYCLPHRISIVGFVCRTPNREVEPRQVGVGAWAVELVVQRRNVRVGEVEVGMVRHLLPTMILMALNERLNRWRNCCHEMPYL